MVGMWKGADFSPSSASSPSPSAPLPQIEVRSTPAPGKRGPVGTSPRSNYSRVNTGTPLVPDAGASEQKSMAPLGAGMLPQKIAFSHEGSMATMTARPRLQDMVKAAMVSSIKRVDVAKEAARQAANMGEEVGEEKTASVRGPEVREKAASADYARKLASAVEYIVETISKEATEGHNIEGPPGVSQATASETLPPHRGQAHHQPPMHPGLRKGLHSEQTPTQLDNDLEHAPGGSEHMMLTNYGKQAGVRQALEGLEDIATGAQWKRGLNAHAAQEGRLKGFEHMIPHKFREDAFREAKKDISHGRAKTVGLYGGTGGAAAGGAVALHHHHKQASVPEIVGGGRLKRLGGAIKSIAKGEQWAKGKAYKAPKGWEDFPSQWKKPVTEELAQAKKDVSHGRAKTLGLYGGVGGTAAAGTAAAIHHNKKKHSSVVDVIRTKFAEDAHNPAKISAGGAVAPETSASGESGGNPVGGAPQGPTSLIGSNESAINYKRNAAYANKKTDLKKYVDEPAMSSETDKTLAQAFNHTGEAGTKFSSAGVSTKTAAAKALIAQLADEASAEVDRRSA